MADYRKTLLDNWHKAKRGNNKASKFRRNKLLIICNDEFHRVYLTPAGTVSFGDHKIKDLLAEVTMDKLAHTPLQQSQLKGCAAFFRVVRDFSKGAELPDNWRYDSGVGLAVTQISGVLSSIGDARRNLNRASNPESTNMGALTNVLKQAQEAVNSTVIPMLKYRGISGAYVPEDKRKSVTLYDGVQYIIEVVSNPVATIGAECRVYKGEKQYRRQVVPSWVKFEATVNLPWYIKVYKKGLAVVQGMLVLEHIKTFPNHQLLLKVIRQGYGFTLNTVHAVYDPERDHISWVTNEEKASSMSDGNHIPRRRRTKKEMHPVETP